MPYKKKYNWISLEHAKICLKFIVKDTVKFLKKLNSIYKRQTHSELYQTSKMEPLKKCLIWYYQYILKYEYDLSGIHKVLNVREYAFE